MCTARTACSSTKISVMCSACSSHRYEVLVHSNANAVYCTYACSETQVGMKCAALNAYSPQSDHAAQGTSCVLHAPRVPAPR